MKKLISILSISMLLICGISNAEIKCNDGVCVSAPSKEDTYIRDFVSASNIRSTSDLMLWMKWAIEYKSDPKTLDVWSSPRQTIEAGSGDCEDYAFLAEAILKELGIESFVIIYRRPKNGHAICVFKEDGTYKIISNTKLIETHVSTMEELIKELIVKGNLVEVRILKERAYEDK